MDINVNKDTVVVFDLDDTLYDELDYLRSAYKEIAEILNNDDPKSLFSVMFSMYRSNLNVFKFLEEKYNKDTAFFLNIYRNHYPKIKVRKGVFNLLKSIKERGAYIAIITDGRSITQRNKIDALKISPFVDYIVISSEIHSEKPSPKGYNLVEEKFNLSQYYYIADNVKKDFITPKKRGWKTIGVIDKGKNIHFETYKYIENYKTPDSYIYTLKELKII